MKPFVICADPPSSQISPVNNNISKPGGSGGFPSSGGTPPPAPAHGMAAAPAAFPANSAAFSSASTFPR